MAKCDRFPDADDLWRFVWEALAEYGACDAWGSTEQRRIMLEWHALGRPRGIAEFIISRANEKPQPEPPA